MNLEEEPALPTPLEDAHLPTHPFNGLKWNGCDTVEKLLAMTEEDFLSMRSIGKVALKMTQEALLSNGIITDLEDWPKKPETT